MENLLCELYTNGFVIRQQGEAWVVEKIAAPQATWTAAPTLCNTLESAVKLAFDLWKKADKSVFEFTATIRYNRGLGVEYKTIPSIHAASLEEANSKAAVEAERMIGGPKVDIREVKVRPKG